MSRRKGGKVNQQNSNQPFLRITINMHPDGRVEVDPKFTQQAIANLDRLYEKAEREDYDKTWDDDHKIAYFQYQIFDEILSQYETQGPSSDTDPAPGVPSLRDSPVRDVADISKMSRANASPLN